MEKALIWFRQDLRIEDNPAWARAVKQGRAIIPVFIWSPEESKDWSPGAASRWWLHHALEDLKRQLEETGHKLILRAGDSLQVLEVLLAETGANALYWNRCYEPDRMRADGIIKSRLKDQGVEVWSGNSSLLREPWTVTTGTGNPYRVYTPYAKSCLRTKDPDPVESQLPDTVLEDWPGSLDLEELSLLPAHQWAEGLAAEWDATRKGGLGRLRRFIRDDLEGYTESRDYPATPGVSKLAPYLQWGQIGIREVVFELNKAAPSEGKNTYYRELIWREFAHHILYHFPDTPEKPLQLKFEQFPWIEEPGTLAAWKEGRTGYPMVDAGMRELWQTGWMHNRSRMVVASFLVKHLLQSWEKGAAWFWDTLVDASLSSNTLGWQWAGGCGADAAPYFRVFNPSLQASKFDPEGVYIRKFIPELKKVPIKYLHTPWEMPEAVQIAAGCQIGKDYPSPVVEHREARNRALEAFSSIKGGN